MVSFKRARDFVLQNGALWERSLFLYLFDGGPLEHLHQCLVCYKNKDGGFGHGLEHDLKCPDSHPLALEFLLTISRDTGVPLGDLLQGTPTWVEQQLETDGSLKNPSNLLEYPYAPWWSNGGQAAPDSIVGNLRRLGLSTPLLEESTRLWVKEHLTLDKIESNEWLFMAYHAYDYYMSLDETEETMPYREATIRNIIQCAETAPLKSLPALLHFAPTPDSIIARRTPPQIMNRLLDSLASTQREDGGWDDEHGLPHWQPYFSTIALLALKNYGVVSL